MSVEYDIKRGRVYAEGNECLRYKISVPVINGAERINEFYKRISEECESFCRTRLCQCLENTKGERLFYELLCRVCHEDEELVSILTRVRLLKGGTEFESYVRALNWSVTEGCMLPPKLLLRKYTKKGKSRFKDDDGIFLYKGELKSLKDTCIDIFFK